MGKRGEGREGRKSWCDIHAVEGCSLALRCDGRPCKHCTVLLYWLVTSTLYWCATWYCTVLLAIRYSGKVWVVSWIQVRRCWTVCFLACRICSTFTSRSSTVLSVCRTSRQTKASTVLERYLLDRCLQFSLGPSSG